MSDADEARKAKFLGEISHAQKELVKVLATMNENLVVFIKMMEKWNEDFVSADQLSLSDITRDAEKS